MKLRRIAAALVIVSLGAASFTFAAVCGQMTDCRITEKTIVGDAAAAASPTIVFSVIRQSVICPHTAANVKLAAPSDTITSAAAILRSFMTLPPSSRSPARHAPPGSDSFP